MTRAPQHPDAPEDLTSRSDLKRANRVVEETLARLSLDLLKLSPKQLAALELPDAVVDAVEGARVIKSAPARQRQLRRVRLELRGEHWAVIRERLDHLLTYGTLPSAASQSAEPGQEAQWLARLLGEGWNGLEAFLTEHPRADRARLQILIEKVDRSSHERRVKAERKLADAIRSFLVR